MFLKLGTDSWKQQQHERKSATIISNRMISYVVDCIKIENEKAKEAEFDQSAKVGMSDIPIARVENFIEGSDILNKSTLEIMSDLHILLSYDLVFADDYEFWDDGHVFYGDGPGEVEIDREIWARVLCARKEAVFKASNKLRALARLKTIRPERLGMNNSIYA